mmetsp:Transcript_242/g.380  ORF Transcript_242/g.380 Transcript_242/m.380 type:complete len:204 (-) Transcript_242:282-893(-)
MTQLNRVVMSDNFDRILTEIRRVRAALFGQPLRLSLIERFNRGSWIIFLQFDHDIFLASLLIRVGNLFQYAFEEIITLSFRDNVRVIEIFDNDAVDFLQSLSSLRTISQRRMQNREPLRQRLNMVRVQQYLQLHLFLRLVDEHTRNLLIHGGVVDDIQIAYQFVGDIVGDFHVIVVYDWNFFINLGTRSKLCPNLMIDGRDQK